MKKLFFEISFHEGRITKRAVPESAFMLKHSKTAAAALHIAAEDLKIDNPDFPQGICIRIKNCKSLKDFNCDHLNVITLENSDRGFYLKGLQEIGCRHLEPRFWKLIFTGVDLKKLAQAITEISELASREFQKTNVFKTKDMREKLYWFLVALFEL